MTAGLVLVLEGWVGWLIAVGGFSALAIPFLLAWRRARRLDAEFIYPWVHVTIRVRVRGIDIGAVGGHARLERFAGCWNMAFEFLVAHGPWPRSLLLERLGPGNKVQVRETNVWKGWGGGQVGGELIAGVIHVGPDLSALAHELIHRVEYALEHGETDGTHRTWPGRGLTKADEAYRAWLGNG